MKNETMNLENNSMKSDHCSNHENEVLLNSPQPRICISTNHLDLSFNPVSPFSLSKSSSNLLKKMPLLSSFKDKDEWGSTQVSFS